MKKLSFLPFGLLYCLCIYFLVFVQHGYAISSVEERLIPLERKKEIPLPKNNQQFTIGADLLYWKAHIDGTPYATTFLLIPFPASGTSATDLETRTPHFSYDTGVRYDVRYQPPSAILDLSLIWTHFNTTGHDKAQGTFVVFMPEAGDKIINDDIGLIDTLVSAANKASASCKLKTNVVDFIIGKTLAISPRFSLRPQAGVRSVWIDIDWDISVTRNFTIPFLFAQNSIRLKVKNPFQATGLFLGLGAKWNFIRNFGLFANGLAALVYGKTKETTKQNILFLPSEARAVLTQNFTAKNSFYTTKSLWDLMLGFFWDITFYKDYSLDFQIAYEIQYWPKIAQKTIVQSNRERERYDLSFQGLTTGLSLNF